MALCSRGYVSLSLGPPQIHHHRIISRTALPALHYHTHPIYLLVLWQGVAHALHCHTVDDGHVGCALPGVLP